MLILGSISRLKVNILLCGIDAIAGDDSEDAGDNSSSSNLQQSALFSEDRLLTSSNLSSNADMNRELKSKKSVFNSAKVAVSLFTAFIIAMAFFDDIF